MKTTLKYVIRDTDRHGNVRLYYRRSGKKTRLRGPEGSPDFLDDYRKAMMGTPIKPAATRQQHSAAPVSFRAL